MDLQNKSVLITGGTKGIGQATAILCAQKGADVMITGRRNDIEAQNTITAIKATGRKAELLIGDIAKPEEAMRAVADTIAKFGGLDLLVHSAGGPVPGGLLEISPEAWHTAFDVHVHPIYYLCKAAVPHMKAKKSGSIVLISSSAGKRAIRTNIAYQAVKGAIPQITRALAFELADFNIRVNCVAPGVIRTAFHDTMSPEAKKNNLDNRIPLHREGTIEQVASLIHEMATNEYITGETFSIDGGLTMRIC